MKSLSTLRIAAASLVLFAVSAQAENKPLSIKGSDTMVNLVTAWAEQFMTKNGDVEVVVTGGGSGNGIASLINGTTAVASASRELETKEKDLAAKNGVQTKEYVVARDGLAIAVNPSNPINELTLDQLKDIYTGKISNWKELGGKDEKIQAYSRESSSGTYVFFQEHVLKKQDYAANVKLMPATSGISQALAADSGAIGYIGLGYAKEAGKSIKVVAVKKTSDAKAVVASEETVLNNTYPIARPLYLVARQPEEKTVSDFVLFALSGEGRKVTEDSGYVTVN